MDITLNGCHHNLALGFGFAASGNVQALFFFNIGNEVRYRLLHHARTFHDLRQEHFAFTKQIADHIHAIHEGAFNHLNRPAARTHDVGTQLFGVVQNKVGNAMHQSVR